MSSNMSLPEARNIEQCTCPTEYSGSDCSTCAAPLYSRNFDLQGLPVPAVVDQFDTCSACSCNRHSTTCEELSGVCRSCADNTIGKFTEVTVIFLDIIGKYCACIVMRIANILKCGMLLLGSAKDWVEWTTGLLQYSIALCTDLHCMMASIGIFSCLSHWHSLHETAFGMLFMDLQVTTARRAMTPFSGMPHRLPSAANHVAVTLQDPTTMLSVTKWVHQQFCCAAGLTLRCLAHCVLNLFIARLHVLLRLLWSTSVVVSLVLQRRPYNSTAINKPWEDFSMRSFSTYAAT